MSLTRQQLLTHVHQPLRPREQRQTSPTHSTYRLRWRQITEWTHFTAQAQDYWDSLTNAEKTQVIADTPPSYWNVLNAALANVTPDVRQEADLHQPFTFLYSAPHNTAVPGARDPHARLSSRLPDVHVGIPDGCFQYNDE